MAVTIRIEAAEKNLKRLLEDLELGETVTLIGAEGAPRALLISLKTSIVEPQSMPDWDARLDVLARKVSQAWNSDRSAVEVLTEMRR